MNRTTTAALAAAALTLTLGACTTDSPAPEQATVTHTQSAPEPEPAPTIEAPEPDTYGEEDFPTDAETYGPGMTEIGLGIAWDEETTEGREDLCLGWSIMREEAITIFTDEGFHRATIEDFFDAKCGA